MLIHDILEKYWGYKSFRPLQEEIIRSVLEGKDTLALLPTGGGKSVCFQVPALVNEGICIVVSPLIALMKDQVENLRKKGIKATYIISGMSIREVDITLDNCVYGDVKFLYLSPERLQSELVRERIKKMKVNLLAVDEAHCISQWGYDFRPSYLQIAELRELIPGTPVLALTATATADVQEDIQEKLLFRQQNSFQKSFERKNLAYVVLDEENKFQKLLAIVTKVQGSGIVYVRNRKATREVATFLVRNRVPADFYHAGLDTATRSKKQDAWLSGKLRVIVATNAFGMGIDKPDVRFVVHLDLPESLEAYYQEAGRAGRDEKKAYAVLLYNRSDKLELESKVAGSFPSVEETRRAYQALGNYYRLAVGSGEGQVFDFDISDFCRRTNLSAMKVLNALKFLERDGYLTLSEEVYLPSRIIFIVQSDRLYKFQVENPVYDDFIKLILRSYGGVFDNLVKVNESELGRRAGTDRETVISYLSKLDKLGVIQYYQAKSKPQLQFVRAREDEKNLLLNRQFIEERRRITKEKIDAIIHYASTKNSCRSSILLNYFGEKTAHNCGVCDVCLGRNNEEVSEHDYERIGTMIKGVKGGKSLSLRQLIASLPAISEKKIIYVARLMMDEGQLRLSNDE